MTGFHALASGLVEFDDGYSGSVPDNWRQGRTAYGGLTTGLALEAARRAFPDVPSLRSMQMNFVGPVTHDPVFKPLLLRRGRNVTSVRVDAFCDDKIVASVVFIFAAARPSDLTQDLVAPKAQVPSECENFVLPEYEAFVPVFVLNFDKRLIAGTRPVGGSAEGYIRVWARHKDGTSRNGTASFLTIADILPPAAMPMLTRIGPVSSINWQMNILRDVTTRDGWWHIETRLTAARDGYSSQIMRFWNMEGELVAEGIQNVAIFV